MISSFFVQAIASAIATYAIHSTVLLAIAASLDHRLRNNATVRERLWKYGAIIPLFSTAIILCWTSAQPVWEWRPNTAVESLSQTHDRDLFSNPIPPTVSAEAEKETAQTNDTDFVLLPAETSHLLKIEGSQAETLVQLDNVSESPATAVQAASEQRDEDWSIKIVPGESSRRARKAAVPLEIVAKGGRSATKSGNRRSTAALTAVSDDQNLPAVAQVAKGRYVKKTVEPIVPLACWLMVTFAGAIAALGWAHFIWSEFSIFKILRSSCPVNVGHAADILNQLRSQRGVTRRVCLLASPAVSEPAATGIICWKIVIPNGLESRLSNSELRMLLSHELGHLVRRDTIWQLLGRLLTAMFPWQLLNFLAVRRWQQSAEFECDDWSLSSEIDAITLAKVLTNVAEWKSSNGPAIGLSATAPPLSRRIEALLKRAGGHRRPRSRIRNFLLTVAILGTLGGVSVFGPRLVWASPERDELGTSEFDDSTSGLTPANQGQLSLLQEEFHAVAADLQMALELLADQESDPAIDEAIHKITDRLQQIENNIQKGLEL